MKTDLVAPHGDVKTRDTIKGMMVKIAIFARAEERPSEVIKPNFFGGSYSKRIIGTLSCWGNFLVQTFD